jgi:F0F1-type ATP synthase membrane subunit c/vacuolar-type H+-ATPase subunit K
MGFETQTLVNMAAYLGGGIAMGSGAIGAAIGEGYTAALANEAMSRNTKFSGDIFKSMLVGQAIAESASIFALVIAMGISRQPKMTGRLTTNMLIGSAVCQTPAIFAMVVALMLMFIDFGDAPLNPTWAALLGAGISTGFAAIGSGCGGGLAAGASCEGIARQRHWPWSR